MEKTDMRQGTLRIIAIGVISAIGVTMGFALFHIPNIELISATIFIGGYLMGSRDGIIIGIFTETTFSVFNPMGMASPPLFAAQVAGMAIIGLAGGLLRKSGLSGWRLLTAFAVCGALLSFIYALLTTASFVFFINLETQGRIAAVLSGISFYVIHIVSNTIIFSTIVPAVIGSTFRAAVFKQNEARAA